MSVPFVVIASVLVLFAPDLARADRPSGIGESCARTGDCASPLVCVRQECRVAAAGSVTPPTEVPKRARAMLRGVLAGVQAYNASHQRLPSSLREAVSARHLRAWQVVDYWGTPYVYAPARIIDVRHFRVCSAGPDRASDTSDDFCAAGHGFRLEHALALPDGRALLQ